MRIVIVTWPENTGSNKLRSGSNRYAFNVLAGTYQGHEITVFDSHYETHSSSSKGGRRTHHHYFSFFILSLPRSCPELTIGPEGFLSKIAQAVGYDDIDFAQHFTPSLTTIFQDPALIGVEAAKRLMALIDHRKPSKPFVKKIPVSLKVRSSTKS